MIRPIVAYGDPILIFSIFSFLDSSFKNSIRLSVSIVSNGKETTLLSSEIDIPVLFFPKSIPMYFVCLLFNKFLTF